MIEKSRNTIILKAMLIGAILGFFYTIFPALDEFDGTQVSRSMILKETVGAIFYGAFLFGIGSFAFCLFLKSK